MQRLILGTRKGLLIYGRHGDEWMFESASFHGVPIQFVLYDARHGVIWASLEHGHWGAKLAKSEDGGATWIDVDAPKYPDDAHVKDGEPATTKLVWAIAGGGVDHPDRLWFGTEPGGLFVTADYGQSFQLVRGLWDQPTRPTHWFGGGRDQPAIHSILVDPRDSERVLVGISCAGVFETLDGGATWKPRNAGLRADFLPDPASEVGQDPHIVVWNGANPDVLWQQNHCGVFRSVDGAANWSEVSSPDHDLAYFGFAAAVDPERSDHAWLVPAVSDECRIAINGALHVARTTDGGANWTALRDGLPQEGAWDLTFRHALDIDRDTLAFGTTTGNAYYSDDRGDTWRTLSHHLPPVYVVRLASW